jgi:hypothetical protein
MAAIRLPHWPPSSAALSRAASRPLPHRRHAAVATALSTLCGLLLLLLAKAGTVLAAQQTPHTGVFEVREQPRRRVRRDCSARTKLTPAVTACAAHRHAQPAGSMPCPR